MAEVTFFFFFFPALNKFHLNRFGIKKFSEFYTCDTNVLHVRVKVESQKRFVSSTFLITLFSYTSVKNILHRNFFRF